MKKKENTKFQINLPSELLAKSQEKATDMGFSSVQDLIRVFLRGVNNDEFELGLKSNKKPKVEYISEEYEQYLEKKLHDTLKDIKDGTAYTARNADELIDQLESNG